MWILHLISHHSLQTTNFRYDITHFVTSFLLYGNFKQARPVSALQLNSATCIKFTVLNNKSTMMHFYQLLTFLIHHTLKPQALTCQVIFLDCQQWRTQKIFMGRFHSVAYGGHVYLGCTLCHNSTSYSRFQTYVLAKFVDIISILFYTHSPYFMCHCTEYKLSALQVTI